jgi:hypothetical protein
MWSGVCVDSVVVMSGGVVGRGFSVLSRNEQGDIEFI